LGAARPRADEPVIVGDARNLFGVRESPFFVIEPKNFNSFMNNPG